MYVHIAMFDYQQIKMRLVLPPPLDPYLEQFLSSKKNVNMVTVPVGLGFDLKK